MMKTHFKKIKYCLDYHTELKKLVELDVIDSWIKHYKEKFFLHKSRVKCLVKRQALFIENKSIETL